MDDAHMSFDGTPVGHIDHLVIDGERIDVGPDDHIHVTHLDSDNTLALVQAPGFTTYAESVVAGQKPRPT